MFRSGVHMWRSTLYRNMTVAPTGAGGGTTTTFGLGFRKCQPAKAAMRTAAPTAIGIKGSLLPATDPEPAVEICASRLGATSVRCDGTAIVAELVENEAVSGAAITPDFGEAAGAAITPDCGETAGIGITPDGGEVGAAGADAPGGGLVPFACGPATRAGGGPGV